MSLESYKIGHRDASQAAAELAAEADAIRDELIEALKEAEDYISQNGQPGAYGVGLDGDHDKYVRYPLLNAIRAALARAGLQK